MMNSTRNSGPTGPLGDPQKPGQRPPRISWRTWWIIAGVVLLFNLLFYAGQFGSKTTTKQIGINYTTFLTQVQANNVKDATIEDNTVTGTFVHPYKSGAKGTKYDGYSVIIATELLNSTVPVMNQHHVRTTFANTATPPLLSLLGIIFQLLPVLFLVGLFYFGSRAARQQQAGVFGFGRSQAKLYTEERPSTTFNDVAGVESAKRELTEVVDFLKDPTKYHRLGARIPKGVLLVGPPGTGKTLMARAVAGEASTAFFSISSTEFVEMFVGVGASRVRDLFERAKAAAPSIVFIDEIDAIGGRRGGGGPFQGSNDEREQTLNQLLVSMDGFEPNEAVIILGATNRPDVLDPALLRPGRFDRQVTLDPPDRRGREAILKIHTRHIPLASDVDLSSIAQATPGMSGADLANLCNEAALTAARRNERDVTRSDFDEALDRITLGAEGPALMDAEERRTVAYHEGGHTLVAMILPNVDPVHRVTITPRGRSLGVTQFRPIDDRRNYKREYLVNRMAVGLGGRAAEEVVFGEITSGAQNDLQQITAVARAMVMQLGMAEEFPPAYFGNGGGGLDGGTYNPYEPREYSDATQKQIDAAVLRLVNEAHHVAQQILRDNRAALDAIAAALVTEESLSREELTQIVNEHRPGKPALPVPQGEPTPVGEMSEQVT